MPLEGKKRAVKKTGVEDLATPAANEKWFLSLPLNRIAHISGGTSDAWSRWFHGRNIGERILTITSTRIFKQTGRSITPGELLDFVKSRRIITKHLSSEGQNYTRLRGKEFSKSEAGCPLHPVDPRPKRRKTVDRREKR